MSPVWVVNAIVLILKVLVSLKLMENVSNHFSLQANYLPLSFTCSKSCRTDLLTPAPNLLSKLSNSKWNVQLHALQLSKCSCTPPSVYAHAPLCTRMCFIRFIRFIHEIISLLSASLFAQGAQKIKANETKCRRCIGPFNKRILQRPLHPRNHFS